MKATGAPRGGGRQVVALAALLVAAACGGRTAAPPAPPAPPASSTTAEAPASTAPAASTATTAAPATAVPAGAAAPPASPATTGPSRPAAGATEVVTVAYRVERRVDDEATAGFEEFVESVLESARGWERAAFDLVRTPDAPHLIVLAEGDEVDRLCLPYDTYGLYSCQNGPVVALNADRWRTATPKWTGDLATYRAMLVNHEFGHLLGQKHPRVQCPGRGRPAPLMAQQSTELDGCLPNPWPLDHEVERAARHDLPIAPPFSR